MACLRAGHFFYTLKLLTIFCLCLFPFGPMLAEEKPDVVLPKALLLGNAHQLHLVINRQKLVDTGAWIAYFNLNLETGLKENTAGLEQVDYKIEAGQLFRYAPSYSEGWEALESVIIETEGEHTVVHFPKPHLAHTAGPILWRVVLFPHSQKNPLYLPKSNMGKLEENQLWNISWDKTRFFPLSWAMMSQAQPEGGLLLSSFDRFTPSYVQPIPSLLESFQGPYPEAIIWPHHSGDLTSVVEQELQVAQRLSSQVQPLVFTRPTNLNTPETLWLNQARLRASYLTQRPCSLSVRNVEETPAFAQNIVLDWRGDVEERIKALSALRTTFDGSIYVWYDQHFLNLSAADKNLCWQAWYSFKVLPMLAPEYDLREVEHDQVAFLVWFRLSQEHDSKIWEELPTSIHLARYDRLRRFAPQHYLKELTGDLKDILLAR
jgi:hypothetical protein